MKNNIKYILSWCIVLASCVSKAQETKIPESNPIIDSLLNVLNLLSNPSPEVKLEKGSDTVIIKTLNLLGKKYLIISDYEQALKYLLEAQQQSEKIKFQTGLASAYLNMGNVNFYQGNFEKALANYLKCLKIRNELKDIRGMADSYANIGNIYWYQGNYEKALSSHLQALKIYEEIGLKTGMASCYTNIGNIYASYNNYEKALESYLKDLKISEEIGDKYGTATVYNNIGSIYLNQGQFDEALVNYFKSLKVNEEYNNKYEISISYRNIGGVYFDQGKYDQALNYYLKALKIREEIGDKLGISDSYNNIGTIYKMQNQFDQSYIYFNKALIIFKELEVKPNIESAYKNLSELFQKQGDFKRAFEYHKLYSDMKDTLLNEQSSKQITEMNTKYESEKKEKDIELLTKDKDLQQAEIGKQKLIRNGSIGGLILALSLGFILLNRFKVTNKQKKVIESQNFQIVESINYAKKIQESLLPSVENMQKVIPGLFVFYKPKDIVSGDFYFFKEFEKYSVLACVDCTGHGVPGGFMSTVGSLLLDKIANSETLSPSEILNKLSLEIIRILHQQNGGEIQDGMDLSICLIDRYNRKIEFSGARNGIIVVTNNESKRYKADPLPVGGNYMKKGIAIERMFNTQSISINSNDWIYMYTDGFMEQVGGEQAIPMNYTQFENQLINVSKKQGPEEKNILLQMELDNWRGKYERDDDVLIIGFQVV